jgi:hypothetical protein
MLDIDTRELTNFEKRLLNYIRDTAPRQKTKLLRKAGNLLRRNVRRETPRKSGELRKSYRVRVRGRKDEVQVFTNKFYAKLVEEGHVIKTSRKGEVLGFVPGKFYFRKGFEKTEQQLPNLLKEQVREIGRELGFDVEG